MLSLCANQFTVEIETRELRPGGKPCRVFSCARPGAGPVSPYRASPEGCSPRRVSCSGLLEQGAERSIASFDPFGLQDRGGSGVHLDTSGANESRVLSYLRFGSSNLFFMNGINAGRTMPG